MSIVDEVDGFVLDVSRSFCHLIIPVALTLLIAQWSVTVLPSFLDDFELHFPTPLPSGSETLTNTTPSLFESLTSAAVTVLFVTFMTFLILLLYKCGCSWVLYGWLLYSCASLFLVMSWLWLQSVLLYFHIRCTIVTMGLFVWNFGVVGVVSVLYYAHPMVRQGYLIIASLLIICALADLPERTAWALLLSIAVYDLVAVLCPYGPLRLLVEEANRRSDPLPGFVYDSDSAVTHSPAPLVSPPQRLHSKLLRSRMETTSGKLGLGDFIFYGLLVGKAAQRGFVEWAFSFCAVLVGMVATFMVLLLYRGRIPALPALPISIFLATFVYVATHYGVSGFIFYAASQGILI